MSLFDKLNKQATAAGITRNTRDSLNWFKERIGAITKVNRKGIMADESLIKSQTPLIGRMYMYFYDPKYKNTLPYYDRFPLIILVDFAPGGFYGLNLHYLDPRLRAKFFDKLMSYTNNNKYDKTTKLRMSYKLLQGVSKLEAFKPCFKHYLTQHVKTRMIQVPANEWEIALFLPTEHFKGKSKNFVWLQSKKQI